MSKENDMIIMERSTKRPYFIQIVLFSMIFNGAMSACSTDKARTDNFRHGKFYRETGIVESYRKTINI